MKSKRMFVLLEVETTLKAKDLSLTVLSDLDLGNETTLLQHHVNVAKPLPKAAADDGGDE
jgi:hypothetical protein